MLRRLVFALLVALLVASPSWALSPAVDLLLSQGAFAWSWNFAATNAIPTDGSVVDTSPSLGGLVTAQKLDTSGVPTGDLVLTRAPNNLLAYPGGGTTLATQTTPTVGPQSNLLLTFSGSGTITLSGAFSGGPYSAGTVPLTPTSSGTITATVSGTVTSATLSAVTYETTTAQRSGDAVFNASPYYGPKFDYGSGLRSWEGRTNLFFYSNTFSTNWGLTGVTRSTDATVAPDGVTAAQLFTANSGSGTHEFYNFKATTPSVPYSVTIYAQAKGSNYAAIVASPTGPHKLAAVYSLAGTSGGNATATSVGTGDTLTSAYSTYLGLGRFRLTLVGTMSVSMDYFSFGPNSDSAVHVDGSGNISYNANGTESVYFYGASLEQAAFQGPYNPTWNAAIAASADGLTTAGALSTALAAGPWAYSWTNGQTGVTSCVTGAAGAWVAPQNGWLKSLTVFKPNATGVRC